MSNRNLTNLNKKTRFSTLIEENLNNLYHIAYARCKDRELASDLVQDTCLKAYNSYMSKSEIENPKAWLIRILINAHIDHTRKKQLALIDIEGFDFPKADDTSKSAEAKAFYKDLDKAMNELDEDQRIIVYLSDVKEYSYKEISEILEIPIGTVMSRLHRARQYLRSILTKIGYSSKGVNV